MPTNSSVGLFAAVIGVFAFIPVAAFTACSLVLAQEVPHFEVASVKTHKGEGGGVTRQVGPTTITYRNVSLRELIELAYGVKRYQFSGPAWLDYGSQDRYDLEGKAEAPTPERELWAMVIPLLQERFKLAIHHETRELPVYSLIVAKGGPKLSKGDGGEQSTEFTATGAISYKNYTMDAFADMLTTALLRFERPVLNRTGLGGRYSFSANILNIPAGLSPADYRKALVEAVASSAVDSPVFTNLKALGLTLESQEGSSRCGRHRPRREDANRKLASPTGSGAFPHVVEVPLDRLRGIDSKPAKHSGKGRDSASSRSPEQQGLSFQGQAMSAAILPGPGSSVRVHEGPRGGAV
jgi:uncharacterized protein (TIGR03435 family)